MNLLSATVKPDFDGLIKTLHRKAPPSRVYFSELYVDAQIKNALSERLGIRIEGDPKADPTLTARQDAALFEKLGYDLVRVHLTDAEFRMDYRSTALGAAGEVKKTSQGYTVHEHSGPVQNWEDLEKYPWPQIDKLDLRPLEWAEKNLPEGMKAYDLTSQFFECSSWLMGYEALFLNMYDEPEFVEALLERIAKVYLDYTRLLCDFDCVGVIWGTDDMGFKTQTLVSPNWLRENIIPLHKQAAKIAHDKGKEYFLHSCGKVDDLMEDLIEGVGIDAKHSFEDAVLPVTDFYARYSSRIGVVGGIDLDFLSRSTPAEVRRRVRETLETCHAQGGYALGSGNSIASYVPVENYLAMLDEGMRFGR